jgi:hypothetical protein
MVLICVVAALLPRLSQAEEASGAVDALRAAASRLVAGQVQGGPFEGSWSGEEAYTGSIVAGLVHAHEVTLDDECRVAAIVGGNFILRAAGGNYYGDEAYALMCLSTMSGDESLNMWWYAIDDFYHNVSHRSQEGTDGYVSQFEEVDPSIAVFYLAHHTVAAFYVDAEEKDVWREALIDYLVRVDDDSSEAPVMALGLATWALASTRPLDDSQLDPDAQKASYWYARTFAELPELLLTHRIPDGELAGTYYWRFDHRSAYVAEPAGGYTEELVSAGLGLAAVSDLDDDPEMILACAQIRDHLVRSIDVAGGVRQHCTLGGEAYYSEAAGVLRALARLTVPVDGGIDEAGLADSRRVVPWGKRANWVMKSAGVDGPDVRIR